MGESNLIFEDDITDEERLFYLNAFPEVSDVKDKRIHCTSCGKHIGTAPNQEDIIRMHPVLRTTQCLECHEFYNSGEFDKGDDGSELYCRWCGQGGEVYCCAKCPYVFCKKCIMRNLSRSVVSDIIKYDNWFCFGCNPKVTWVLRAQHFALINYIEQKKREIDEFEGMTETERNRRLNEDESFCCKPKKRSITNNHTPTQNSKKSRPETNKTPSTKSDDNDIVCTPDILSMFQQQAQPESQLSDHLMPLQQMIEDDLPMSAPIPTVHTAKSCLPNIPPLQLVTTLPRTYQKSSFSNTPVNSRLASDVVTREVVVGKRTTTDTSPVYHTINGFRIDLNSVAQKGTYRLPNGKLIQVKKQTAPERNKTRPAAPAKATPSNTLRPLVPNANQYVRPIIPAPRMQNQQFLLHPQNFQVSMAPMYQNGLQPVQQQQMQHRIIQQPQSQPPIQQQQAVRSFPIITPNSQTFPNTPVGAHQAALAHQIFAAQDICQHSIGKLNTLMSSNAYKSADKFTDVKDLYTHVSYLLTYVMGRFKTLQDKCHGDMVTLDKIISDRDLEVYDGVDANGKENKKRVRRSSEVDDDVQIVEANTTTIEIDSDDDDGDASGKPSVKRSKIEGAEKEVIGSQNPKIEVSSTADKKNEKFLETLNAKVQNILSGNVEETKPANKSNVASKGMVKSFDVDTNKGDSPSISKEDLKGDTENAVKDLQNMLESEVAGDKEIEKKTEDNNETEKSDTVEVSDDSSDKPERTAQNEAANKESDDKKKVSEASSVLEVNKENNKEKKSDVVNNASLTSKMDNLSDGVKDSDLVESNSVLNVVKENETHASKSSPVSEKVEKIKTPITKSSSVLKLEDDKCEESKLGVTETTSVSETNQEKDLDLPESGSVLEVDKKYGEENESDITKSPSENDTDKDADKKTEFVESSLDPEADEGREVEENTSNIKESTLVPELASKFDEEQESHLIESSSVSKNDTDKIVDEKSDIIKSSQDLEIEKEKRVEENNSEVAIEMNDEEKESELNDTSPVSDMDEEKESELLKTPSASEMDEEEDNENENSIQESSVLGDKQNTTKDLDDENEESVAEKPKAISSRENQSDEESPIENNANEDGSNGEAPESLLAEDDLLVAMDVAAETYFDALIENQDDVDNLELENNGDDMFVDGEMMVDGENSEGGIQKDVNELNDAVLDLFVDAADEIPIDTENISDESNADCLKAKNLEKPLDDALDKISECGDSDFGDSVVASENITSDNSKVEVPQEVPAAENLLDPISSDDDMTTDFEASCQNSSSSIKKNKKLCSDENDDSGLKTGLDTWSDTEELI